MKTTIALVAFTLLVPIAASAQGARINLSALDRLGDRATEKQEITIDSTMLKTAGQALVPSGRNTEAAKQILSELEDSRVRTIGLPGRREGLFDGRRQPDSQAVVGARLDEKRGQ